jgi:hypothetical protein
MVENYVGKFEKDEILAQTVDTHEVLNDSNLDYQPLPELRPDILRQSIQLNYKDEMVSYKWKSGVEADKVLVLAHQM